MCLKTFFKHDSAESSEMTQLEHDSYEKYADTSVVCYKIISCDKPSNNTCMTILIICILDRNIPNKVTGDEILVLLRITGGGFTDRNGQ